MFNHLNIIEIYDDLIVIKNSTIEPLSRSDLFEYGFYIPNKLNTKEEDIIDFLSDSIDNDKFDNLYLIETGIYNINNSLKFNDVSILSIEEDIIQEEFFFKIRFGENSYITETDESYLKRIIRKTKIYNALNR